MGVWLLLITKATVQGGMPRLIGTRAATLISPARLSLLIMPAAAAARARAAAQAADTKCQRCLESHKEGPATGH